jgi:ribosomal protein S18 acetylase RimI-like enzyme
LGRELIMESTLELRLLGPADWWILRAARLEALRDSPDAFTSSYAQESKWSEREWHRMLLAATWIVAREAERVIGMARSINERERPEARHVESVWVAPERRRRGVFRTLLHSLAELHRQAGVTDLMLWVLENNHEAQSAYEALGFEPTGERQFLPNCGQFERRLRLGL